MKPEFMQFTKSRGYFSPATTEAGVIMIGWPAGAGGFSDHTDRVTSQPG